MTDSTTTILGANALAPCVPVDNRTFIVVGNHYINLASVQRIEAPAPNYGADSSVETAIVYFVSGDSRTFYRESAAMLRRLLESSEFRTSFVCHDAAALPFADDDTIWSAAAREATQP